MKYTELNLDSRLETAILQLGYTDTTPIQEQTIPHILEGRDVAGLAQTGTGKTAAFLIPLIERILKAETAPENERAFKDWKPFQSILVLVPTRELAEQIHENVLQLTVGTGLKSFPFYGGTGYEKQKEALKNGVHFMISTPGRLIDLYKEHFVDFKRVRAVVFDEADRMFDMGFKDDMTYILGRIDRQRQFLVFSATLNFDVLNTAYQFGAEPVEINISRDQAKAENVKDAIFHIGNNEKPQHLLSIMKRENPRQTIIFTNFKNSVDRIAQFLTTNGIPAMGLSSLMSQAQRTQVITQFKAENNKNVLVATDVAARGLDITDVDLVINFELPQDPESYVHRIGRTGRAGREGKAFSFVSEKDVDSLARIEEFTKKKIDVQYMEDGELIKDFKPMGHDRDFYDSRDRGPRAGGRFERGGRGGGRGGESGGDRGPRGGRGGSGDRGDRRDRRPIKGGPDRRNDRHRAAASSSTTATNQTGTGDASSTVQQTQQHGATAGGQVVDFKRPRGEGRHGRSGRGGSAQHHKATTAHGRPGREATAGKRDAAEGKSIAAHHGPRNFRNRKPEGLVKKVQGFLKKLFS